MRISAPPNPLTADARRSSEKNNSPSLPAGANFDGSDMLGEWRCSQAVKGEEAGNRNWNNKHSCEYAFNPDTYSAIARAPHESQLSHLASESKRYHLPSTGGVFPSSMPLSFICFMYFVGFFSNSFLQSEQQK